MWVFKLILKNAGRHKLRTLLTILGLAVAVVSFSVIRTLIDTYYGSADVIPPDRLVTRHAVSFVFDLPFTYEQKIANVPGVEAVAYGTWFGGIYNNDPRNFFPSFAVGPENYLDIYSEYIMPADQKEQFLKEKNAAFCGQQLANRFGWKPGEVIRLTGQIYPGEWEFILRGIYKGREPGVDESALYFHWDYLYDRMQQTIPEMVSGIGWYIVKIDNPDRAPEISASIDKLFKNSSAETLTETEKAFTLSFLAMMDAIVTGMRIISYMVIGVILLVMVNTMLMTARERISEYALLKTLGFRPFHLTGLVLGESLLIAMVGGCLGIFLTFPIVGTVARFLESYFTRFEVYDLTIILAFIFVILVGILAAVFPIIRAVRLSIAEGLRNVA
jgi:putative ABC transport system permease protein